MNSDLKGIGMTSQRSRNRLVRKLRDMGICSDMVLDIIASTPRHIFVDEALASRAYENTALPIGFNQTISQPYIVARMTEALLSNGPLKNVLEVGTGCGYQTAILAQLVDRVYSIERIEALQERARDSLRHLNINNIRLCHGDGNQGWEHYAPFDGIIVTAAPTGVPQPLLEQLAENGRMVIPVGLSGEQKLLLITRTAQGFEEHNLDWVSFVPMVEGVG